MRAAKNTLTPRKLSVIGVRLVVVLLLANCLFYVGLLLDAFTHREVPRLAAATYAATLLVYAIVVFALLWRSDWFAETLSRGLPGFVAGSRWSRVELVAAILAGVAAYEVISGIPSLFNQLYALVDRYLEYTPRDLAERDRINGVVVGFVGATLRVGVAAIVFVKSGRLAMYWDRRQTADGLRAGRGPLGRVGS